MGLNSLIIAITATIAFSIGVGSTLPPKSSLEANMSVTEALQLPEVEVLNIDDMFIDITEEYV